MKDVHAFDPERRTNAATMVDAAQLGWIGSTVLDLTHGDGKFWTLHKPKSLTTSDLYKPADLSLNFLEWPESETKWSTVVFDPPYKLSGTPSAKRQKMNTSYGVEKSQSVGERLTQLAVGTLIAAQYVEPGGHLLVKCMDQVANGDLHRQTLDYTINILDKVPGWKFESWLHVVSNPQSQVSQVKPRSNYSTLLCFKNTSRKPK